jgi:hypothetical protein
MMLIKRAILSSLAIKSLSSTVMTTAFVSASPSNRHTVRQFSTAEATVTTDADVLSDPMFIEPLTTTAQEGKKSPDELINIAKRFLQSSNGLGGDPNMLSESFAFQGPVVGPLTKDAFVSAIGSVDFATAFPEWTPQFYGFFVDPLEAQQNRVWYTARGEGVNAGPLPPFAPEATNNKVVNPPQVCSLTINHTTGLIERYTIGYVVDRDAGNTGGLGGLYGILYALGKPLPFPEAQPWKMSLRYNLFQKLGNIIQSR